MIKETLSIREVFEKAIRVETEDKDDTLNYQIEDFKKQLRRKEDERDRVKRIYVVAQVITEDEMLRDMKKVNEEISNIKLELEKLIQRKENRENSKLSDDQIDLIINNIKKMN
jgi:site-specific DNA recombinase